MRILLWVLFLFTFVLYIPKAVSAHAPGFPPFFKIEGVTAESYFLEDAGVYTSELEVPQDIAHKTFLTGEEIEFEIDFEQLETMFPIEVLEKTKFTWEFGDGESANGDSNKHSYKNSGSYILSITADFKDPSTPPQLIESVLIHIVPDENYSLPKADIQVNGERATVEDFNILEFDLADSLSFDGSGSDSSGSEIVSYAWDFGDDKTAEGATVDHRYVLPQAFATVLLRVTDANGLIDDAIVNVRNSGLNEPASIYSQILGLAIPGAIVILIIGGGLALFRKKNNPTIK